MGGTATAAPAAAVAAAASEPLDCAGIASGLIGASADGSAICGSENDGGGCDCDGTWPSEFISSALMRCVHCARRTSIRAER